MTDSSSELRRARRAFVVWGIVAPLVMTAVAVGIQLIALPSLPEPVAIHWDGAGTPDGFAPAWVVPVLTATLGAVLTVLLGVFAFLGSRHGEWGPTLRFLGAMTPATVGGIVTLVTWSLLTQRGLGSGTDAPGILPAVLGAAGAGVAIGLIAWFSQPALTVSGGTAPRGAATTLAPLGPNERIMWVRSVTMSAPGMIVLVALVLVVFVAAAVGFVGSGQVSIILLVVGVILGGLIAATTMFRVRIDDEGLRVASYLGIPRFRIPLAAVSEARAVFVSPMADFGGWGVRIAIDGRRGVVLRRGEALEVTQHGGRVFVVTVDDAQTASDVLNGLRVRAGEVAR